MIPFMKSLWSKEYSQSSEAKRYCALDAPIIFQGLQYGVVTGKVAIG